MLTSSYLFVLGQYLEHVDLQKIMDENNAFRGGGNDFLLPGSIIIWIGLIIILSSSTISIVNKSSTLIAFFNNT